MVKLLLERPAGANPARQDAPEHPSPSNTQHSPGDGRPERTGALSRGCAAWDRSVLVAPVEFKLLLRHLPAHDLIRQDYGRIIYLGNAGEQVTSAPGFYAAFSTPVEANRSVR